MRAFGLLGQWIRSLAVGPFGFVLFYTAAIVLAAVAVRWRGKRSKLSGRALMAAGALFAGLFFLLTLPYPGLLLRKPLISWAERLEKRHPLPDASAGKCVVVIYGGGILPGGAPSNTTLKRLNGGLKVREQLPDAWILVSEGGLGWGGGAAWLRRFLVNNGVPDNRILLETRAGSTHQNAIYVSEICSQEDFDSIVLVTSDLHMPRSYYTSRRHGLNPSVHAVDPGTLSAAFCPEWNNLVYFYRVVNEYAGIIGYKVLGWL